MLFALLLMTAALAVGGGTARAQTIGLYADELGTQDELYPPLVGDESTIYVILRNNYFGVMGVSLALPIPDCIPYDIIAVTPLAGVLMQGNIETGIDLVTDGCPIGDVALLKVNIVRTSDATPGCCTIQVVPSTLSPIPGEIAAVDCSTPEAQLKALEHCDLWIQGEAVCIALMPPSDPTPPDDASNVATNPLLDCTLHELALTTRCAPLHTETISMYFGTESDPPLVAGSFLPPFDPGDLLPNTKYYWRVVHRISSVSPVSSPVWSFITSDVPSPTNRSTWGKIKALYR